MVSVIQIAFDASQDVININRLSDGLCIDANESFFRIHGNRREEVIGQTSTALNVWFDPGERQQFVLALQQDSKVTNLEARFRTKTGDVVCWSGVCVCGRIRWHPLHGRRSARHHRAKTGRSRLEEAALQNARLAAIVASSNDAIISKTIDGIVTSWNQARKPSLAMMQPK